MILILIMMVLASLSGGSFPGSNLLNKRGYVDESGKDLGGILPFNGTNIPEVVFCLIIASVPHVYFNQHIISILPLFLISYLGMQTATGPALPWGLNPLESMSRARKLTPLINWISGKFKFQYGDINYCRTWMMVKGFIIGLPLGGLPLAILWPLSYEIGYQLRITFKRDFHMVTEMLSGLSVAIIILIMGVF